MKFTGSICLLLTWVGLCWAQSDCPIEVDVAIVGGGASGSYAAVRLREDYNKTILVVEKANRLGGHAHAYQPPSGSNPINYGVMAYLGRDTTLAFFDRFNVSLVNQNLTLAIEVLLAAAMIDFDTGLPVSVNYGPVDAIGVPLDLAGYAALSVEYQPWFENGFFKTGDIPDDLLLPFGEFLEKYNVTGSLAVLSNIVWLSNILETPTWFVMANGGAPQLAAFDLDVDGPTFKYPAGSAETLYDNILTLLSEDVLLESTVINSTRTDSGVRLTVQTPDGQQTVLAKKLLIAATPSPENVGGWDLNYTEAALFDKFSWETLYVGVVNNTGIPSSVYNVHNAVNDATEYYLPHGNFTDLYARGNVGEDVWRTCVLGDASLTAEEAEAMFIEPLTIMGEAGTYDIASPEVVAFASHGAVVPKVSAEELQDGFFTKLYSLQGQRSTYWTGLTWAPDYSSILWDFTETLFEDIVDGL